MTELRTRAFIGAGIVGLLAAGILATGASTSGCGSDDPVGGSGGSGGGGGTSGGGSGGGAVTCTSVTAAPIADFGSGTAGTLSLGVGTPYAYKASGLAMAPTVATGTGALEVVVATGPQATSSDTYAGFGIPFNSCANVTSFTGVKFSATGTLSAGCTIQFSLVDRFHSNTADSPLGACPSGCYPGAKVFDLPATATDVSIAFADISGGAGMPATPVVDPSAAINVQWQINVPANGCTGNVTIDNIVFY